MWMQIGFTTTSCPSNYLWLYTLLAIVCGHNSVCGRESDGRSKFLYANDPLASLVRDYQIHDAPSGDYKGDPHPEHEEKHIKPFFLRSDNGPRVVEFYSPWCGHCQNFKPKYIKLAHEVTSRNLNNEQVVEFHAISCSHYHWVCKDNNITGYPTVLTYPARSAKGKKLQKFTAETIANSLGISLEHADKFKTDSAVRSSSGLISRDRYRSSVEVKVDASVDAIRRVRKETFADAALSFTFALQSDIFPQNTPAIIANSGELPLADKLVFKEWIDLLYWTLPPTWRLHTLINDLRDDVDHALATPHNLLRIVDNHHDVVNDVLTDNNWSQACSRGRKEKQGHMCGLWNLFHIVSIGVAERHAAVLGAKDRVTVNHAGETLRNYIQHFFGCPACEKRFLELYDTCAFNRCKRFKQKKNIPSNDSWKELAIWLWEIHNQIHIRLAKDLFEKDGRVFTKDDELSLLWPSRKSCYRCWKQDGSWVKEEVYAFLKGEYWPGGVNNFKWVVLEKKSNHEPIYDDEYNFKWIVSGMLVIVVSFFILSSLVKKRYLEITGRHKKLENDCV